MKSGAPFLLNVMITNGSLIKYLQRELVFTPFSMPSWGEKLTRPCMFGSIIAKSVK